MPDIALAINGTTYTVACDPGQEERIRQLAQYLDGKVGEFVRRLGQAGEARLLLLAGLVLADELAEATEALRHERARPGNDAGASAERHAAADGVLAAGIDSLAERIEAVASRLEAIT